MVCPHCGEENPERARFCLACGQGLEAGAPAGEERKVVSILFVDLVGFTNRSDRADPEDVRATLRPYHERVKADIERFGGTVEKFIGDAVMAVFGAPVAHEDDAERAVRSALRVLDTIEELRGEGLELAVRAAVATGEAVVALGARPERGEGDRRGRRREHRGAPAGSAATGTIIVDEVTMRSSDGAIVFEPLEPVVAKGKADPIAVWRALEARSRVGQPETATATPFVGREHERALLLETFLRVERESHDPARHHRRRAGRRKEPARHGAPGDARRSRRDRHLAPRPLPAVRRRHHVLGARRGRQGRGRDPGVRRRGRSGGEAGAGRDRSLRRCFRARVARVEARAARRRRRRRR